MQGYGVCMCVGRWVMFQSLCMSVWVGGISVTVCVCVCACGCILVTVCVCVCGCGCFSHSACVCVGGLVAFQPVRMRMCVLTFQSQCVCVGVWVLK